MSKHAHKKTVHEVHEHVIECHDDQHEHGENQSCSQLLSTLSEYVDGSLNAELCADLERHMKDCQRCRIVVNTMKKTVELYQETGEETQLPEDVRERLFLRLNLEDYLK